ncbi:hypothetical protein ACFQ4K_01460 [Tistrella bauzanensis]
MTTSESITPRVRNVTFGLVNRAVKTVDALTLLVAAVLARPLSEATLTDITWAQSLLLGVLAVIPLVQINDPAGCIAGSGIAACADRSWMWCWR